MLKNEGGQEEQAPVCLVMSVPVTASTFPTRLRAPVSSSEAQVLSLWDVRDDATARFMVALHQKLAAGAARADAFRDVQLEFLAEPSTADPRSWAAFFLQGDPSSFDGKAPARSTERRRT